MVPVGRSLVRSFVVIPSFFLSTQILLQRFAKSTSDHYRKILSPLPPLPIAADPQSRRHKQRPSICIKRFSASVPEWLRFTELPTRAVRDIQWNLEARRQHYPTTSTTYIASVFDCHVAFRSLVLVLLVIGIAPLGFGQDSILDNERSIYFCHFIIARKLLSPTLYGTTHPAPIIGKLKAEKWLKGNGTGRVEHNTSFMVESQFFTKFLFFLDPRGGGREWPEKRRFNPFANTDRNYFYDSRRPSLRFC